MPPHHWRLFLPRRVDGRSDEQRCNEEESEEESPERGNGVVKKAFIHEPNAVVTPQTDVLRT